MLQLLPMFIRCVPDFPNPHAGWSLSYKEHSLDRTPSLSSPDLSLWTGDISCQQVLGTHLTMFDKMYDKHEEYACSDVLSQNMPLSCFPKWTEFFARRDVPIRTLCREMIYHIHKQHHEPGEDYQDKVSTSVSLILE